MALRYEILNHTGDLALRFYGRSPKELFENAAFAFYDSVADLEAVEEGEKISLNLKATGWEELLVNWLRELLYLLDTRGFLAKKINVQEINPQKLSAELKGEDYHPQKHPPLQGIKAVTYHQLEVKETPQGWEGKVIFDI